MSILAAKRRPKHACLKNSNIFTGNEMEAKIKKYWGKERLNEYEGSLGMLTAM